MPDTRVNVPLDNRELTALVQMSEADCRHPREQLRYLLREEAYRRGLLPKEQPMHEEEQDGKTAVTNF